MRGDGESWVVFETYSMVIYNTSFFRTFTIAKSEYPPHVKYVKDFVVKSEPELQVLVKQQKIAIVLETLQHGILCYQPYFDKDDSKFLMIMKNPLYWYVCGSMILFSV